jgi:glycine oxidase
VSGKREEVIIVGGGIIGCSIAWHLSCRGRSVRILERSEPGGLASHAAAGILGPFNETDRPGPFLDLMRRSLSLYPSFVDRLAEETGLSSDFTASGILSVGFRPEDRKELLDRFTWQSVLDPSIVFCEPALARILEPALTGPFECGIYYPDEGHVFAPRLIKALLGSLTRRRVPLDQGVQVSRIEQSRQGTLIVTDQTGGRWEAEKIVLAAGAMLSDIQMPPPTVSISPVNGQILAVRSPGSFYRRVVFYPPHGYFVPKMDGTVVIGATEEQIGPRSRVTPRGLMEFLAPLATLSPEILSLPLHHTWSGLRPKSPDGFPVLGPHPECPGLFFAGGHYRNGILLAPVTGEILADWIEGDLPKEALSFLPDRFMTPE